MSDQKKLNPQIKTIEIGVRETREIKIYPLSVKDQFELTKELADSINELLRVDFKNIREEEAIDAFAELLSNRLTDVLRYVCDQDQVPKMEELTNIQLSEIANIVFEVNYEGLIKNFKDLFKRGKDLFPRVQLPQKARRTK